MLRSVTMMVVVLAFIFGAFAAAMFLVRLFFHLWDRFAERGLPTRRPLRRKQRSWKP